MAAAFDVALNGPGGLAGPPGASAAGGRDGLAHSLGQTLQRDLAVDPLAVHVELRRLVHAVAQALLDVALDSRRVGVLAEVPPELGDIEAGDLGIRHQ